MASNFYLLNFRSKPISKAFASWYFIHFRILSLMKWSFPSTIKELFLKQILHYSAFYGSDMMSSKVNNWVLVALDVRIARSLNRDICGKSTTKEAIFRHIHNSVESIHRSHLFQFMPKQAQHKTFVSDVPFCVIIKVVQCQSFHSAKVNLLLQIKSFFPIFIFTQQCTADNLCLCIEELKCMCFVIKSWLSSSDKNRCCLRLLAIHCWIDYYKPTVSQKTQRCKNFKLIECSSTFIEAQRTFKGY